MCVYKGFFFIQNKVSVGAAHNSQPNFCRRLYFFFVLLLLSSSLFASCFFIYFASSSKCVFLFFFFFSYNGNFKKLNDTHTYTRIIIRQKMCIAMKLSGSMERRRYFLIYMFFSKSYAARFEMFSAIALLCSPSSAWLVLPRKFFCHSISIGSFLFFVRMCVFVSVPHSSQFNCDTFQWTSDSGKVFVIGLYYVYF